MNIETQLFSFLVFFIYGFLLFLADTLLSKKKWFVMYIVSALSSIVFIFLLYNINGGNIHPYFIIVFLIGIVISKISVKFIKKYLNILKCKMTK